ncbi:hypothetical protein L0O74_13995, partial [Bifidobacterium longum]|nr:hypothetical protein [Bifidobacterium longum]
TFYALLPNWRQYDYASKIRLLPDFDQASQQSAALTADISRRFLISALLQDQTDTVKKRTSNKAASDSIPAVFLP